MKKRQSQLPIMTTFANETYLNCVKNTNQWKALCQLRTSSYSHVRLVDAINYHMSNKFASFVLPKKLESQSRFLFECQFYNDLRHGSVIEKAILGNEKAYHY